MKEEQRDERVGSFIAELKAIRRGGSKEAPKPHKLLMVLSVLDLLDRGTLRENKIPFSNDLIRQFEAKFRDYAQAGDRCQPGPPFFHLRTAEFWKHKVKDGQQTTYDSIQRVGGATLPITDNIDYAYLRDDIFELFSSVDLRKEVKAEVIRMLEEERQEVCNSDCRLGLAFHESFSIVIPAISQLLHVVSSTGEGETGSGKITRQMLTDHTSLGPNYVRAMPRWACGTGILDQRNCLTALGRRMIQKDPSLIHASTLWAMHYHLAAPQGPGPRFWNYLVSVVLRPGDILETAQVAEAIKQYVGEYEERKVAERTLRNTASVFLGTYSKSDALGPLGLIEQVEPGRYLVKEPDPPSPWVFAYMLSSYWQSNWGEVPGVHVIRVTEPGGPASLLMMGSGTVNRYLRDLQAAGFATVQRHMPPFQLNRNWSDPSVFLERLYD